MGQAWVRSPDQTKEQGHWAGGARGEGGWEQSCWEVRHWALRTAVWLGGPVCAAPLGPPVWLRGNQDAAPGDWPTSVPEGSKFESVPAFHRWVKACGWGPTWPLLLRTSFSPPTQSPSSSHLLPCLCYRLPSLAATSMTWCQWYPPPSTRTHLEIHRNHGLGTSCLPHFIMIPQVFWFSPKPMRGYLPLLTQ